MADRTTIKLRIAKEEDRQTVAGILAKAGYGVKFGSEYKINAATGKRSTSKEHFLLVESVEEAEWKPCE